MKTFQLILALFILAALNFDLSGQAAPGLATPVPQAPLGSPGNIPGATPPSQSNPGLVPVQPGQPLPQTPGSPPINPGNPNQPVNPVVPGGATPGTGPTNNFPGTLGSTGPLGQPGFTGPTGLKK